MLNRRTLLKTLSTVGIGTAVFHRSLAALFSQDAISVESIKQAEWITGLELDDDQRDEILKSVQSRIAGFDALRNVKLTADVPMAIHFAPTSNHETLDVVKRSAEPMKSETTVELPEDDEAIAFLPVYQLSELVRTKKLSSVRLTKIYLARLKKYSSMLRCVVTLTEELAMEQAKRADAEISSGKYRGALHGIPWGAKDLIAVEGYPTSWGIPHYKDRELEGTATVAKRLEEAGAVLVAKLSLGALANGDVWFEGKTRCPWDPRRGSSGSSAGSACSVIAGLVGFTLGSETLGSIISPSVRCGCSSLRPTFGRVSRSGCMPLSWSLDKIGPICRSVQDCALVFDAIHGWDGKDQTANNYDFQWPSRKDLSGLKVGYAKSSRRPDETRDDLRIMKELGCELVEIELPRDIPLRPLIAIIDIEAASVFDDLLRAGHTEGWNSWDEDFRAAQYVSAVDYVRIQRVRNLLIEKFEAAISDVDVLLNANDLVHTNFTGHPSVVMPVGYVTRGEGKIPRTTVLTGKLNEDEKLLAIAQQYQAKVTANEKHPDLDPWLEKFEAGKLDEPDKKEEAKQ
ncbi:MAG: amidase [Mariniblastus sp.]